MTTPNAGQHAEKLDFSYIACKKVKSYSHSEIEQFLIKLNIQFPYNLANYILGHLSQNNGNLCSCKQNPKKLVQECTLQLYAIARNCSKSRGPSNWPMVKQSGTPELLNSTQQ